MNALYSSVTSEKCSTSPVFNSDLARRIDLMNPPNSAPMTSSGTRPGLMFSTVMPSRPIRLTARVPSTRSRMPSSTSLNDTPLLPLLHLGQPLLELRHLRFARCAAERVDLSPHVGVPRLAPQD